MKRKILVLTPLILLVAGFLLMKILSSFKEEKTRKPSIVRPKVVDTEVVQLDVVAARLVTYGTIASKQPVSLVSEVSGTLLEGNIPFQTSQTFRKGDLLLRIDDRQMQLELNATKSDLLTALSSLLPEIKVSSPDQFTQWQEYFDSIRFDSKIKELPEASDQRIKALLARNNIYKLFFTVKNLEIRADKYRIYAPFNGSIISTQLRVGGTAAPGTRFGEIINLDDLEVEIQIPAQDVRWLDENSKVTLTTASGDQSWKGHIERIGSLIEDRSQSVLAYIQLDDIKENTPLVGVFVNATIEAQPIPNAIEVARKVVYEDEYVFIIKEGKLARRDVEIGFDEGDFYVITDGLLDGDTLVVELLQGVAPGMPAESRN